MDRKSLFRASLSLLAASLSLMPLGCLIQLLEGDTGLEKALGVGGAADKAADLVG